MTVAEAITKADSILPGRPAPEGQEDPRWQAIIAVGEFIEAEPEVVWRFIERWGKHPSQDLRSAIATCLLEHLLEYHFELVFERVTRLARSSRRFAWVVTMCGRFGRTELPNNAPKFNRLLRELKHAS